MASQAKLVVACLILSLALIQISEATGGPIATYWGVGEGHLGDLCKKKHYSYINVAYVKSFGGGKVLSPICEGTSCIRLGEDIKACQQIGIKVLISLGGPFDTYSLISETDAQAVAKQLWNSYIDEVNFDGIDFRIENGSALYYEYLAQTLKDFATANKKEIILSAFPGCVYPDRYLARAIHASYFDIIWIQYFNNSACQYDSTVQTPDDLLLISWTAWNLTVHDKTKLFLGIPATPIIPGYIPCEQLINTVIPNISANNSKYAGVLVWNSTYDLQTKYSSCLNGIAYE
ncbi:endochitinase Ziz m 1.0101-like [Ziziphus jujuba]|uniref:chitinase n=1 Tax=Ziziphus jujuba TaxID=326968 RepID=A0ABM4AAY0_ZIZJJ|nr:endochitinase Ziz m 1.0101-like [Ziziphus jujuba]